MGCAFAVESEEDDVFSASNVSSADTDSPCKSLVTPTGATSRIEIPEAGCAIESALEMALAFESIDAYGVSADGAEITEDNLAEKLSPIDVDKTGRCPTPTGAVSCPSAWPLVSRGIKFSAGSGAPTRIAFVCSDNKI
jgi:hypothetical protein